MLWFHCTKEKNCEAENRGEKKNMQTNKKAVRDSTMVVASFCLPLYTIFLSVYGGGESIPEAPI